MKGKRKPVLITGAVRSGTTWAGQMLVVAPRTAYIHEPFNLKRKAAGLVPNSFEHWFQHVCADNAIRYEHLLRDVLHYKFPLRRALTKAKSVDHFRKVAEEQCLAINRKVCNPTPIVKDPIALFSAEWLSARFDMNVLVMIRHPAAFCSSVSLKGWDLRFVFESFMKQPLLRKKYLSQYEPAIREHAEHEKPLINQSILLWNCCHHVVNCYRQAHPEWLFVKHEDLSLDPICQFRSIYQALDLELTQKAQALILESSGSHNPIEQMPGQEYQRHSKANVQTWKERLTEDQIALIRDGTAAVSRHFYGDEHW